MRMYKFCFVFVDEEDTEDSHMKAFNLSIDEFLKQGGPELEEVETLSDLPKDWSKELHPYNGDGSKTIADYFNEPKKYIYVDGVRYRRVDRDDE